MIALADGQVVELELEVEPGAVISYDMKSLCSALGITDATRIAVETDGLRRALVTVYPSNPLAVVRPVTRDDLKMDKSGRILVGYHHNGRPVKIRLFDPSTGSAQRFLLFGTTGAGKSRALQIQLIAEKVNGVCSALCDLKEGQSVPEARTNVDLYGSSQEMAILILRASVNVAKARMRRYSAMGRNSFMLGEDPLFHTTLDEVNRLLERGAPYRDEATYLIKELGRTGRSVGVGIRLAAQASHLEELGGSDTLRAMMKEGEILLLRWSSSMMKQLVSDGVLPMGDQLMPIGKTLAERKLRSQFSADFDEDDDDAPGTQGMGYHLSSPYAPTGIMRHLRVGSIAPLPGLDPEILALYGDDVPACLEEASWEAAGEVYAARHDPAALAVLEQAVRDEQEQQTKTVVSVSSGGGSALLEDRIRTVLAATEDPMTADDILAKVNADGGKQVRPGSIKNTLGLLADNGDVVRPARGLYAPA